jgi:cytochrome P450
VANTSPLELILAFTVPSCITERTTFGEDVDIFRPERWLGEEEKVRKMKNALFTFSSGKYNCLKKNIARMEIAKLVPSVIRAFEVSVCSPGVRGWPRNEVQPFSDQSCGPREGLDTGGGSICDPDRL